MRFGRNGGKRDTIPRKGRNSKRNARLTTRALDKEDSEKSEIMDIEDDEDPHHMRDNRRNTNINAMNDVP